MKVDELKIGNNYYLCDMSYHTYEGEKQIYSKYYFNFTKEQLKLINIGKFKAEQSVVKNSEIIYNDVQLLHEKTGIILFSQSRFLKESKNESMYCQDIMNNLITEKINILNNNLKGFNNYYILPEQYSLFQINTFNKASSIKEARDQEFKVKKMVAKEKAKLLLIKLEYLIDEAIEKSDKNKFLLYSGRYNKIKETYFKKEFK